MALTPLQRRVCRLPADRRKAGGESYVAGGTTLNELLGGTRRSRDVDPFHDTAEALAAGQVGCHQGSIRVAFPELLRG